MRPPIHRKLLCKPTFIWLLLITISGHAQTDTTVFDAYKDAQSFKGGWISESQSIGIQVGAFQPNLDDLNFNFARRYGRRLRDTLFCIGISAEGTSRHRGSFNFNYITNFSYFPRRETTFSDTVRFRLSGFQISYVIGKDVFPKNKLFDLGIYAGFSAGRLNLLKQDYTIGPEFLQYRNPFFSPKILVQPKFNTRHVVVGLKFEYLFDVSQGKWKSRDQRLPAIGEARSSGLFIQLYLGLRLMDN
jgi:hypothetical protein